MDDSCTKKPKMTPSRARVRYTIQLEVDVGMEDRLENVKSRIQRAKNALSITSRTPLGNVRMMERLLDSFEQQDRGHFLSLPPTVKRDASVQTDIVRPPFVLALGENTTGHFDVHSASQVEGKYFISSYHAMEKLMGVMVQYGGKCPLCGYGLDTTSFSVQQHGHAVRVSMDCVAGHSLRWFSSGIVGGKFTANLRMVHGFTSSGLTETQYASACNAAHIGHVDEKYINTVYNTLGYKDAVRTFYELKLAEARTEVQEDMQYVLQGDVIITDARHDSSRAAQHTTVTALSYRTKKVIYSVSWSKSDMASAASREVPMTKALVDSLTGLGHRIGEVAHDYVPALKLWLDGKGITNSYDTWHGGKGVKRAIKKVASGLVRDSEKTWFSELSDKVKCTKTHIYYAMKNCDGDAEKLRSYIINIVDHYKGVHSQCHEDSRCNQEGYVCSKKPLLTEKAIAAYRKAIQGTTIYKNARDYAKCRDTFWVESLHMVMLIYVPKRIHFGRPDTYEMRIQLSILDWNENVLRETSSLQNYQRSREPDRIAPHRVLKDKSYDFRDAIWATLFRRL